MYIGSQWKTPIKMNDLRVYTPFSSISETTIYPPHNSTGARLRLWLIAYRMTAVSAAGMGVLISVVVPEHSATLATSVAVIVIRPAGKTWYNDNTPQL